MSQRKEEAGLLDICVRGRKGLGSWTPGFEGGGDWGLELLGSEREGDW